LVASKHPPTKIRADHGNDTSIYILNIYQLCPLDSQNCSSTNIGLLLSNCYRLDIELLPSDLLSYFKLYLELYNFISSKIGLVGKLRQEATSSLKEGEHSYAPKSFKIAHQQTLDYYCPTVTV
jgi:hypothetical protein